MIEKEAFKNEAWMFDMVYFLRWLINGFTIDIMLQIWIVDYTLIRFLQGGTLIMFDYKIHPKVYTERKISKK